MRYDLDFKLKVITCYRQGHSRGATGERCSVNPRFVCQWIEQYQHSGIDAINPKTSKTKYGTDFKYEVLTTMLT